MKDWILSEQNGGVGCVRLNRPERYNAFTADMLTRLSRVLDAFSADPKTRAVLIWGEGKAFCAGADLQAVVAMPTLLRRVVQEYHRVVRAIFSMPKPVVIAVNGVAAGGGFSLAISGDYRVASEAARFTLGYMRAGLAIDGGSSRRLRQLAGLAATERLVYANPTLTAVEALEMGLVHEVFAPDRFEEKAMARATELAEGPTQAYAAIKELLAGAGGIEAALDAEAEAIVRTAGSLDGREGIAAFVEKRAPIFSGR